MRLLFFFFFFFGEVGESCTLIFRLSARNSATLSSSMPVTCTCTIFKSAVPQIRGDNRVVMAPPRSAAERILGSAAVGRASTPSENGRYERQGKLAGSPGREGLSR